MPKRGGWQVRERKLVMLKAEYLEGNLSPTTSKPCPLFTEWVKEIEDFAKQTAASRCDSGITEEQALCAIKGFISATEKATRLGNVPIFIKDSIDILEKAVYERERLKESPNAPGSTERLETSGDTQRFVGSFAEKRTTEPLKAYRPYWCRPKFYSPISLQRPEVFGRTQRSVEANGETLKSSEGNPIDRAEASGHARKSEEPSDRAEASGHARKSEEPSPVERLEASGQTQKSEPSHPTQGFEATRENRASVIVTAATYESMPSANPPFVPLVPKVERT